MEKRLALITSQKQSASAEQPLGSQDIAFTLSVPIFTFNASLCAKGQL